VTLPPAAATGNSLIVPFQKELFMATTKSQDAVAKAKDAADDFMEELADKTRDFIKERPLAVAIGCLVAGYLWGKLH
jgi:hypothetical protein